MRSESRPWSLGEWREKLERDLALTRPVTIRCSFCSFVVELPVAAARAAFAAHECAAREPAARS